MTGLDRRVAWRPTRSGIGWLAFVALSGVALRAMLSLSNGHWGECPPPPSKPPELYLKSRPIPGGGSLSLALAESSSCALMKDGSVFCWGERSTRSVSASAGPVQPFLPEEALAAGPRRALSLGAFARCATSNDGHTQCVAGTGGVGDRWPVELENVRSVSVGSAHACAVLKDGELVCWGRNSSGQILGALTPIVDIPFRTPATPRLPSTRSVAVGDAFTCALPWHGPARCWGASYGSESGPVVLPGTDSSRRIVAGRAHACALLESAKVVCWGANEFGQLGDGSRVERTVPVAVLGIDEPVTQVAAARDRSCALGAKGHVYCWGKLEKCTDVRCVGRMDSEETKAYRVDLDGAVEVALGGEHACARLTEGSVVCWGQNGAHQVAAVLVHEDHGLNPDRCETITRVEVPATNRPVPVLW